LSRNLTDILKQISMEKKETRKNNATGSVRFRRQNQSWKYYCRRSNRTLPMTPDLIWIWYRGNLFARQMKEMISRQISNRRKDFIFCRNAAHQRRLYSFRWSKEAFYRRFSKVWKNLPPIVLDVLNCTVAAKTNWKKAGNNEGCRKPETRYTLSLGYSGDQLVAKFASWNRRVWYATKSVKYLYWPAGALD